MASVGSKVINRCPEYSGETKPLLGDPDVHTRPYEDYNENSINGFHNNLKTAQSRYVTIEIPVALASLTYTILKTLEAEYIRERIADDFNHTLSNQSSACDANFSSDGSGTRIEDEIQSETSRWLLYLSLAYGLPSKSLSVYRMSPYERLRTIFWPLRKWSKIVRTTFVRVIVTKL